VSKWVGLLWVAVVGAANIASVWWSVVNWQAAWGFIWVQSGYVAVAWGDYAGLGKPGFNMFWRLPSVMRVQWWPHLSQTPFHSVLIPLWIPLVVVAAATALLWTADRRGTQRESGGRCPKCQYDRRGLAPDAKCPECGTIPTPTQTK
jgi:hypothetical protein